MSRLSQLAAITLAAAGTLAHGELITDPVGDFLATYNGPQNPDLDIVSAQAIFNGDTFTFTSTQNGAVGMTPGIYVWGIDTGTNAAPFASFGETGVLFDTVVILEPGTPGGSFVLNLIPGGAMATTLPDPTVNGDTLSDVVPLADLGSTGFLPQNYLVNLWTRDSLSGSGQAGFDQIADFAPNNSDASVTVTPEPATTGLFLLCGIALGAARVRRKAA